MNYAIWLLRLSQWARNPPPLWKVLLVLGVIAACLALYGFERLGFWPDWLAVNPPAKPRF